VGSKRAPSAAARETLILFARFPESGKVKTRLIPSLGAEGAAREHRLMVEHTVTQARLWQQASGGRVCLAYSGGKVAQWRAWLGNDFNLLAQTPQDLGAKLIHAVGWAFAQGAQRVVVVGSDCPKLRPRHIQKAFSALETKDLVLGPAHDGGYYLIGQRFLEPGLFTQVPWSTSRVFSQTQKNAKALRWRTAVLETLSDVDTPRDLKLWTQMRTRDAGRGISIIIPAWNEAGTIGATVKQARQARQAEVLVVDGGSTDATRALARAAGAKVMCAPLGRAAQQMAGAARARGSVLLFLHADTRLPDGYDICVREILSRPQVALGAFTLKVDAGEKRFRWLEFWAGWRARSVKMSSAVVVSPDFRSRAARLSW